MNTLLVMAGGTGGHIYPAIAVAEQLQSEGWHVEWLGAVRGLENEIVPKNNFTLHVLPISGLRGNGILGYLTLPWRLTKAVLQARHVIKTIKPNVVLGMGGFASGPGGLACFLTRTPLVIHEQNALAGMTNKCLAKVATTVLQAFPNALGNEAITTGNPVRRTINRQTKKESSSRIRLLVIGGSQGARAINNVIPPLMAQYADRFAVLHQTGKNLYGEVQQAYAQLGIDAHEDVVVKPYIEDMSAAYQWADVVISRSGALSVSEIAMAGLPSILIPFPFAVDDHQTKNADYLVKEGAAVLIQQSELTCEKLSKALLALSNDRTQLQAMANAALQCAKPNATHDVAGFLKALV